MEFLSSLIIEKLKKHPPKSENFRHAKRNWKKRAQTFSFSNFTLCFTFLFLYIPLFVIIVPRPRFILIPLKKIKSETPIITSGKTIGKKLTD